MASSLNGTGLTFSSGQTLNSPPVTSVATSGGISGGTITTTGTLSLNTNNFGGIGSTQLLWCSYGTSTTANSTISGSYLFYISSVGSIVSWSAVGSAGGAYQVPASYVNRTTAFTLNSAGSSITFTPIGGTWRLLNTQGKSTYDPCSGITGFASILAIRVS